MQWGWLVPTPFAAHARLLVRLAAALATATATPCLPPSLPAAAYEELAVKLVAALREAISTDLSDAEERQVWRQAQHMPAPTHDGSVCENNGMPFAMNIISDTCPPFLPPQVRRAADPAKSLVREFLGRWKDNPAVAGEESYVQLTSAIQQLGTFYQVR